MNQVDNKPLLFFHGTARIYEKEIARNGLRSFRESGEVYVTPIKKKALRYAQRWAVGLNVIGAMDKPEGIVVAFELKDTEFLEWEMGEFSVKAAPASAIRSIEHFDFSELSQGEKTIHLFDLLGVVCFDKDNYTTEEFTLMAKKVKVAVDQIPHEELQRFFESEL